MRPMADDEKLVLTFATTGVTAGMHLGEVRRDAIARAGCLSYHQLFKTRITATVNVGGLFADGVRRPPSAHGTAFLRLDTPDGMIDVIVPEEMYLTFHERLHSAFLIVEGVLRQQRPIVSVLLKKIEALR